MMQKVFQILEIFNSLIERIPVMKSPENVSAWSRDI